MAEEYTEAGRTGKRLRESISSKASSAARAIRSGTSSLAGRAKSADEYITEAFREYVSEPLLNVYPQAVNVAAATGEAAAGLANRPIDLGRYPYYDLPTRFDRTQASEQEEVPTITVSKPRTKQEPQRAAEKEKPAESAPRRMYRAIIRGEPESDELFDTKEAAESYLKGTGKEGVVAGISFKGKSAEDVAQKEAAYREGLQTEKTRKADLAQLYAARQKEAADRVSRMRQAAEEYDAAATPELKAQARSQAEAVRLEQMLAQGTRGMSEEQKKKLQAGVSGVLQRRGERELETQRQVFQAREQTRARLAGKTQQQEAEEIEKRYTATIKPLYRAAREARRARDFGAQAAIEDMISTYTADVPRDRKERVKFFQTEAGRARNAQLIENRLRAEQQRREEENLRRRNAS